MMLEQIKRVAAQTGEAGVPVRIMFGVVTETAPLTVMVDSRFPVTAPALIVPRELCGHTHEVKATVTGDMQQHTHTIPAAVTRPEAGAGLKKGERVILLRNQGGQEYLVLGRCL
jgi:hypothetical protein